MIESLFAFGVMAGPALGGSLYEMSGYSGPFLMTGATYASAAIIAIFLLPSQMTASEESPVEGDERENALFQILRRPGIWASILLQFWTSLNIGYIDASITLFLRQVSTSSLSN